MTLARHVYRQLWISLRLLLLLALPIGAAAAAVLLGTGGRVADEAALQVYAALLGAAVVGVAALLGTAFSSELRDGTAAWLVVRAVPRGGLLAAWLWAPVPLVLLGMALSAALMWLGLVSASGPPEAPQVPIAIAASCGLLAVSGLGAAVLVGALLAPRPAGMVLLVGGAAIAAGTLLVGTSIPLPTTGFLIVAGFVPSQPPLSVAFQAMGLSLAATAVLWTAAAAVVSHRDL